MSRRSRRAVDTGPMEELETRKNKHVFWGYDTLSVTPEHTLKRITDTDRVH